MSRVIERRTDPDVLIQARLLSSSVVSGGVDPVSQRSTPLTLHVMCHSLSQGVFQQTFSSLCAQPVGVFDCVIYPPSIWGECENLNDRLLRPIWGLATGAVTGLAKQPRVSPPRAVRIKSKGECRVEKIVAIQSAFGISVQLLAKFLNISRAQLYKWMDAAKEIELQESSTIRLNLLDTLAVRWATISQAPLNNYIHDRLSTGGNIVDLLSADVLDASAVGAAFMELATLTSGRPKSLADRMLETGFQARRQASMPSDE